MSNSSDSDSNSPPIPTKLQNVTTNSSTGIQNLKHSIANSKDTYEVELTVNRFRDTQYNNQNTVVMVAETDPHYFTTKDIDEYKSDNSWDSCLCPANNPQENQNSNGNIKTDKMIMHDTRIFFFRQQENSCINKKHTHVKIVSEVEINAKLVEVILTMLTYTIFIQHFVQNNFWFKIKKCRLAAFYIFFRLADNTMLIALVASLFLDNGETNFGQVVSDNGWVFIVLGGELFYDVMEHTVRIWILNRISLYIGCILYVLYALAFTWDDIWGDLVIILYTIRAVAYFLEVVTDYCIDLEIQHDLNQNKVTTLDICCLGCLVAITKCCWSIEQRKTKTKGSKTSRQLLPNGWKYAGSRFVWTLSNVFVPKKKYQDFFNCKDSDKNSYPPHRLCFDLMSTLTLFLMSPFIVVASVILLCLGLFKCGCCCKCIREDKPCKNTICGECRYQRSF